MQLRYLNFGGHDHSGDFCVHTLGTAGEVRNALQSYMLNKPFANVQALAALGDTTDDDASVQARVFMREGKMEGAFVNARHASFLTPMKPDVLSQVLTYLEEKQSSSLMATISGQSDVLVIADSTITNDVVAEWQKVAGRTAEPKQVENYFLHSEILSPPSLPTTRFDSVVRRAELEDAQKIFINAGMFTRKDFAKVPEHQKGELLRFTGFPSAYVVDGGSVIKSAMYNLSPISQSGSLLTRMCIDVGKRSKAARLVKEQGKAMAAGQPLTENGELAKLILPELTEHFAALARTMEQQGRWLMLKTTSPSSGQPEALPVTAAAKQLGFMEAGGLDVVVLKNTERQAEVALPGYRILRL